MDLAEFGGRLERALELAEPQQRQHEAGTRARRDVWILVPAHHPPIGVASFRVAPVGEHQIAELQLHDRRRLRPWCHGCGMQQNDEQG